ncbi:MAG: hypothetical protein ABI539_15705 [Acidobacteriota bacterium]
MISVDDDLAECLNISDFGQAVIFEGGLEVNARFIVGTGPVEIYGVKVEATEPSLTCRTVDVADVRRGHTVTVEIDGQTVTFKVERKQNVGTGLSVVYLQTS